MPEMIPILYGRIEPQGIYQGKPGLWTVRAIKAHIGRDPEGITWFLPFGVKTPPDMAEPMIVGQFAEHQRERLNEALEPWRKKDRKPEEL